MGKRSAGFNISVHPLLCHARHVFRSWSGPPAAARRAGRHIRAADEHNRLPMSTPKRLGVVMDPIGAIKYAKDSTLAMLLAAQARGFELAYLEQHDLLLRDGVADGARAAAHRAGRPGRLVHPRGARGEPLGESRLHADAQGPAVRHGVHLHAPTSSSAPRTQGALVVNRPQGLRDMNEKVYTAWFPQCCAPDPHHARHGRHGRLPARARQDRLQAARRHGRALDLRARARPTRTRTSCSRR